MSNKLKVENHPNLIKDTSSNAILNTNLNEIMDYKKQKMLDCDVQKLKNDFNLIQSDLSEIKKMLTSILNK